MCRSQKLQVMRVQSTEGQHSEIGLYLQHTDVAGVLAGVRTLQPLRPWQFKTSKQSCLCDNLQHTVVAGVLTSMQGLQPPRTWQFNSSKLSLTQQ